MINLVKFTRFIQQRDRIKKNRMWIELEQTTQIEVRRT